MVVAYALLEAETSAIEEVRAAVAAIGAVQDVHVVAGDVDLIARIDVADPGAVSAVITGEIAGLDGVLDTETYISMDG
ncbi:MAG: Lrp/AsnC ligand binding domain-containing protein [Halodesulfurarchaeum sp.]|nr:Lrp/AsnC ligand binding domain-containing protein [Halodesulfurarchaeum sp.]